MSHFYQRGFTALEKMGVVVLVGIAAAQALPRLGQISQDAQFDQAVQSLAKDLSHAQSLARSWGRELQFNVRAGSYSVQCLAVESSGPCAVANSPVYDPGRAGTFAVSLPAGTSLSANIGANQSLAFDTAGRPNLGVLFSLQSGNRLRQITLESESGRVSVN